MFDILPQNPQRYSDDLETIEPDEAETARDLAETMLSIAKKTFENSGHAMRSAAEASWHSAE